MIAKGEVFAAYAEFQSALKQYCLETNQEFVVSKSETNNKQVDELRPFKFKELKCMHHRRAKCNACIRINLKKAGKHKNKYMIVSVSNEHKDTCPFVSKNRCDSEGFSPTSNTENAKNIKNVKEEAKIVYSCDMPEMRCLMIVIQKSLKTTSNDYKTASLSPFAGSTSLHQESISKENIEDNGQILANITFEKLEDPLSLHMIPNIDRPIEIEDLAEALFETSNGQESIESILELETLANVNYPVDSGYGESESLSSRYTDAKYTHKFQMDQFCNSPFEVFNGTEFLNL